MGGSCIAPHSSTTYTRSFGSAQPAHAGGNCHSWLDHYPLTGLDGYAAEASCSSLDFDFKARPNLVRDGGPDFTGPWFTRLNTAYSTNMYTCYAGCHDSLEISHV
jgi:hypothetical protein